MNLRISLVLMMLATIFVSCDDTRFFDEYKSVGTAWHKDSVVTFSVRQDDTTHPYNLFVNIRDNDDYKFSNLFLIVAMQQPNGLTHVDTLEYQMANPDGTLMGDGFSSIKENKLYYKEKVRFPLKGEYKFSIRQAVRPTGKVDGVTELEGITEVGLRIESIK
ncbi:MAG TPA: gliding motility lipoprotein GldH [Flavobacterium sp.]|nr:gliding motility lipoprotein GldH [Flavobacterium sp.]